MPVKNNLRNSFLLSLLYLPVVASEQEILSAEFLEYLAVVETKVDGKWSSPVDMDIEHYLQTKLPEVDKSGESKPQGVNHD